MKQQVIIETTDRKAVVFVEPRNRKTISIRILDNMDILIRYPQWLSEHKIRAFCEENKDKIFQCYDRAKYDYQQQADHRQSRTTEEIYQDGSSIPLGNGSIELRRLVNRDPNTVKVYKKTDPCGKEILCMVSGVDNNPQLYRNAVSEWLREYARQELTRKVEHYAAVMKVTVGEIRIREQKTRWGSCSSRGNLNFNWKLILMPERIQEYLVVHELAHRKEMNHSDRFWKIVENHLPDYQKRQKELRETEHLYRGY